MRRRSAGHLMAFMHWEVDCSNSFGAPILLGGGEGTMYYDIVQ